MPHEAYRHDSNTCARDAEAEAAGGTPVLDDKEVALARAMQSMTTRITASAALENGRTLTQDWVTKNEGCIKQITFRSMILSMII